MLEHRTSDEASRAVQPQLHFHRRQLEFPFHSIKVAESLHSAEGTQNIGDTSSLVVGLTASALILQRADGINARRAQGWRKARGQRSDQQRHERGGERQWVAGADLVKHVAHQARQAQRRAKAQQQTARR